MGEMLLNGRLYGASGIRELTQAQYDALPVSKLTDGVLYCIKDTGIVEGDKYAPVIYSLEEREIGVWTDGKPLYQKTITGLSFRTVLDGWANSGASLSNVDKVIKCECGQNVSSMIEICFATVENTVLYIWTTNRVTYEFNIINILYTKTTDLPGSGTWGTDGVPMVHYDGNEKIIGTWFGETLYEKTIITTDTTKNAEVNIDVSSLNIATCINIFGTYSRIAAVATPAIVITNMFNDAQAPSDSYYSYLKYTDTNKTINYKIQFGNSYDSTDKQIITIQYTKTS